VAFRKRGRVGLSFGYLVTSAHDEADGVKVLDSVDLFEITLTPSPANADTRILSTKSAWGVEDLGLGDLFGVDRGDHRRRVKQLRERERAAVRKAQSLQVKTFEP
jgi:Caudovirus prohead serine protease